MKLSEFLSKYIEEQDISGRELARRCDLSAQTIFNIINGVGRIDTTTLAKIANGTGYTNARFGSTGYGENTIMLVTIPGVTDRPPYVDENSPQFLAADDDFAEYLEELRTRPEMRMLFDSSRGMSPEQVKAIVQMIENFK